MSEVRKMLVGAVSICIVRQIVHPFCEKYSDAVMDKLQQHKRT